MKVTKSLMVSAAMSGLMLSATPMIHASSASPAVKAALVGAPSGMSATKDKHACKGQNSCKGKGGCKAGDNGCKGKNSCKGKGGCATDGSKPPAAPTN